MQLSNRTGSAVQSFDRGPPLLIVGRSNLNEDQKKDPTDDHIPTHSQ